MSVALAGAPVGRGLLPALAWVIVDTEDASVVSRTFEGIYSEHRDHVFRFVLSQVRSVPDAEDITAQTFLAAYRSFARARPDADGVRYWLFRIAKNLVHDHRRRERRRDLLNRVLGQARPRVTNVEDLAEINTDLAQALTFMSELSPREQLLVGLRVGWNFSYAEIGKALGLSEDTANRATLRAFERLRRGKKGAP